MKTEFEELLEKCALNFHEVEIARLFWNAQQVKIDKLEHDLGNEKCANRMLQHVLDKEVKS